MNRLRILLGIVAVAGILGALIFFFTRHAAKPLTYRGRSIEYWFAQLPVTPIPPPGVDLGNVRVHQMNVRGFIKSTGQQYGSTNLLDDAAIDAIAAFGTNAVPFLMARLQGLDSAAEKEITKAATNTGVGYLPFRNADLERLQAVTGLIHVKMMTPEASQSIMSLRTNSNPGIASAAAYVLKRRAALDDSSSADSARSAEPGGPANGSQPIRSATNSTLSAAGSRR
jgi:hypothetical protein